VALWFPMDHRGSQSLQMFSCKPKLEQQRACGLSGSSGPEYVECNQVCMSLHAELSE